MQAVSYVLTFHPRYPWYHLSLANIGRNHTLFSLCTEFDAEYVNNRFIWMEISTSSFVLPGLCSVTTEPVEIISTEIRRKMKKKKSHKALLWAVLALILGVGGYSAVHAYKAPLSPVMEVATATIAAPVAQINLTQPTVAQSTAAAESVCGQTGSMIVLFLGSDASQGNPPYGADSVRLIKIDYDAQKVNVITFPRDLIVQTSALNNANYPQAPLGVTFKYANQAATGTEVEKNTAATSVIAQVIMNDFGVRPDYYITVQMNQLAAMIDTIGGVEINIPVTITTERGVTFAAGTQTLDGALATEYVRAIQPGGDSARIIRQNDFLNALKAKVISAKLLPKVPTLISQFQDAVSTDLSPEQLVSFACLASKVSEENITFDAINTPDLVTGNTPNIDAIKAFLIQKLGK